MRYATGVMTLLLVIFMACSIQDRSRATDLSFWTVGNGEGLRERFGPEFYQSLSALEKDKETLNRFLLTVAERPLTEAQILRRSGLASSQVKDLISRLHSMRVIVEDGDRWKTTLPVVTDRQMKQIQADLQPMAGAIVRYLRGEMGHLKAAYDDAKSPFDPEWREAAHLIIDKFVIDGPFHSAVNKLERERHADHSQSRIIPVFFLEQGEHFSTFGTNWYPFTVDGDQREVYVLHGAAFDRYAIPMNRHRGDSEFTAILFKLDQGGGLSALTPAEKEVLTRLQWIADDRLVVPMVEAHTIRSLFPLFSKIGAEAAEAASAHFSILDASYEQSPYAAFLENRQDYIQVCIHTLFSTIIEALVDTGALPPIPECVTDHFGVYIILGKLY